MKVVRQPQTKNMGISAMNKDVRLDSLTILDVIR